MSMEGISLPPPSGSFHPTPSVSGTGASSSSNSSIGQSKSTEEFNARKASIPVVVPFSVQILPSMSLSPDDLKRLTLEVESSCVNRMWTQFNDNVQELANQRQAKQKIDLEQIRLGLDQLIKTASGRDAAIQGANEGKPVIGMSMGIISIMATSGVAAPGLVGMEGLADAFVSVVRMIPEVDMKVIWGFIGPAFATSLFSPAVLNTFGLAKEKNGIVDLRDFVKSYVDSIRKLVNSPNFDGIAMKLVPYDLMHTISGLDNKAYAEFLPKLTAMIRLTLLFTALGAYYKYETGHLTGKEIIDLVNDPFKFNLPEKDPRLPIIAAIQHHLSALKGDEKKYLEKVSKYFDGNPDYEDIFSAVLLMQQSHRTASHAELKA